MKLVFRNRGGFDRGDMFPSSVIRRGIGYRHRRLPSNYDEEYLVGIEGVEGGDGPGVSLFLLLSFCADATAQRVISAAPAIAISRISGKWIR
jgi:hypothetical protein